jgi:hypothetical protein
MAQHAQILVLQDKAGTRHTNVWCSLLYVLEVRVPAGLLSKFKTIHRYPEDCVLVHKAAIGCRALVTQHANSFRRAYQGRKPSARRGGAKRILLQANVLPAELPTMATANLYHTNKSTRFGDTHYSQEAKGGPQSLA